MPGVLRGANQAAAPPGPGRERRRHPGTTCRCRQKHSAQVRGRIAAAETAAGRPPGSVRLIAVSKTFDASAIRPVIAAGQRVFGENRVQEAAGKWPALQDRDAGHRART